MDRMDELEEKLGEVLSSPEKMQQVMEMARALGLSPPAQEPPKPDAPAEPLFPPQMASLLTQAGALDKKQEDLLCALKPFLRPARQERIDRAMQAARLSHLAGYALRTQSEQP